MTEIEQLKTENADLRLKLEDAERCAVQALHDRDVFRNAPARSRSHSDQVLIDELNKKVEFLRAQALALSCEIDSLKAKDRGEKKKTSDLRVDLRNAKAETAQLGRKVSLLIDMLRCSEEMTNQWRKAAELQKAFE